MKYSELIHFEPITEIVRFSDLADERKRENFVRTFVFSDLFKKSYIPEIVRQLNFTETEILVNGRLQPKEFFGLQIVGSYGTGKSHLMTLFSLIAEDEKYLQYVGEDSAREELEKIAGKYKVLRFELSSEKELWGIVSFQIDKFLRQIGVNYSLMADDSYENNDVKIQKMMTAFEEVYPDKGLLIVIDEMLAYLKGRSGSDKLNRDLQVLQALAQVANSTKFRIAFGVQEAIYSAAEFQFAREMLLHVNDRYRSLTITKEDVKYIAQKRMLRKDDGQRQQVRDHLSKFTNYFSHMHGHLEDYVTLFPVHPSYFENFDLIKTGKSQREIMRTLSDKFSEIMNMDVPADQPGLICYDSYWQYMDGNATLKTDPDVARVSEIMQTIFAKIDDNFTGARSRHAALAKRIACACAVKILQNDLSKTNGATAETLTNDLAYVNPLFENFDDLVQYIESIAHNVQEYTAGQYFFKNKDNGEYHLRVEGGINYEEQVSIYAENSLSEGAKDEYFFQFLQEALPIEDETYRSAFKIWNYAITWRSHNVARSGYIFMGYDTERPTTQPQQHFYIYFPPIFETSSGRFSNAEDEVYFLMDGLSADFRKLIALYGAAIALGNNADTSQKGFYESLKKKHFDRLRDIFDREFYLHTEIQYCGVKKPISQYQIQQATSKEDAVGRVASEVFEEHFCTENPDYPAFTLFPEPTTMGLHGNIDRRIRAAKLKLIAPTNPNREGEQLLTGLGLWNNGLTHTHSPYANSLLHQLEQKGQGQVLNRDEILELFWSGDDLHLSRDFKIEDCYEFIVMAALVAMGEIELVLGNGHPLTAANIGEIESLGHRDYILFRCIRQPRGYNFATLKALFMTFIGRDLTSKLDVPTTIPALMDAARKVAERAARMEQQVFGGLNFQGVEVISTDEGTSLRYKMTTLKGMCDQLQGYNTQAKLKNLPETWTPDSLRDVLDSINELDRLEKLYRQIGDFRERISYLEQAIPYAEPDLKQKMQQAREKVKDILIMGNEQKSAEYTREVDALRESYAQWYFNAYRRAYINEAQKQQKDRILSSSEYIICRMVCDAPFVLSAAFDEWQSYADKLQMANPSVTLDAVRRVPFHGFNPLETSVLPDINQLAESIKDIYAKFVQAFHETLDDPAIMANIGLLEPAQQTLIKRFKSDDISLDATYAPQLKAIISSLYSGFTAVNITTSDLAACFSRAMNVDDARTAFNDLLNRLTMGKNNPRIILKLN